MEAEKSVDKFHATIHRWSSVKESSSASKLSSEISRLRQWLVKHQSDVLNDGYKDKLVQCVEMVYKFKPDDPEFIDIQIALVDDILKLPEGKLVNSKGKKKVLKWMESLTSLQKDCSHNSPNENRGRQQTWMVAEIDPATKTMTLISPHQESDGLIENIPALNDPLFQMITDLFEDENNEDCCILVELSQDLRFVVKAYNKDNT